MLYFRVDMNETIATGHVMRCLSIAEAGKKLGRDSTFILADCNAEELIRSKGFKTIVLNTKWNDMESELPALLSVINKQGIDSLLVDSYSVTVSYLQKLKEKVRLLYIDDLYNEKYPVHTLINYDGAVDKERYLAEYKQLGTKVLFGYEYVPLRKEFSSVSPKEFSNSNLTLLIMSGGSDTLHSIRDCLRSLDFAGFSAVYAICGRYNCDYEELSEEYSGQDKIHILKNVNNIETYMMNADICISAAGNTFYELASCGVPTILFAASKEQVVTAQWFEKEGLAPFCGLFDEFAIKMIGKCLKEYADDVSLREKISTKLRNAVDGEGAKRIALEMMKKSL